MRIDRKSLLIGALGGAALASLAIPSCVDSRRDLYARQLAAEIGGAATNMDDAAGKAEPLREACRLLRRELRLDPTKQGGGFDLNLALFRHIEGAAVAKAYDELGYPAKLWALWHGPSEEDIRNAQRYVHELNAHTRDARAISYWAESCSPMTLDEPLSPSQVQPG
jgi:hypothetical protein